MKKLEVVAAVIVKKGKVLIAQKPANHRVIPNKWEFPGGKTRGQPYKQALTRELREELQLEVEINGFLSMYSHSYDGETLIHLHAYLCTPKNEPTPLEHQRIEWVDSRSLMSYDLAVIDQEIAKRLLKRGFKLTTTG